MTRTAYREFSGAMSRFESSRMTSGFPLPQLHRLKIGVEWVFVRVGYDSDPEAAHEIVAALEKSSALGEQATAGVIVRKGKTTLAWLEAGNRILYPAMDVARKLWISIAQCVLAAAGLSAGCATVHVLDEASGAAFWGVLLLLLGAFVLLISCCFLVYAMLGILSVMDTDLWTAYRQARRFLARGR